jgi:hypothetical protein
MGAWIARPSQKTALNKPTAMEFIDLLSGGQTVDGYELVLVPRWIKTSNKRQRLVDNDVYKCTSRVNELRTTGVHDCLPHDKAELPSHRILCDERVNSVVPLLIHGSSTEQSDAAPDEAIDQCKAPCGDKLPNFLQPFPTDEKTVRI